MNYVWLMALISLPLIYILSCIKTQFEKEMEYIDKVINLAHSEQDPIKQAVKMTAVSMKIANQCMAKVMYGPESEKHHWQHMAEFYEMMRKNWRKELEMLSSEK